MNKWAEVRNDYMAWLREFPVLACVGTPGDKREVIGPCEEPVFLDNVFWSKRTQAVENAARMHMPDSEIDVIFDDVTTVIDEDLSRFDSLIAFYGRFLPDGDPTRIEWEREAAHSVKRDLAWAGCERATGESGFFTALLPWYNLGRWPIGWEGKYPAGHLRVV